MPHHPVQTTVLLCSFLCALASPAFPQRELADVIEQAEKSVVRIEVRGVDGDSLGSGFIVDDQGTMITNCHVLAGAQNARAFFADGRAADVLGTIIIDATRDIIVARISSTNAPAIPVSSTLPRKGERVLALGAPKGLAFTATQGIVSAIRSDREMESDVGRTEIQGTWIQVDTAISPGNSGGPLINSQGEVVGMSTLASQGSAQNLNFGISAIDIGNAIKYSAGTAPVPLPLAAAKVRMSGDEHSPGSGPGGILDKLQVAENVIDDYVATGISQFNDLKYGLNSEAKRLRSDLTEMRRGNTFIPPGLASSSASIVRATLPGSRTRRWFFRSSELKDSTINSQLKKIREYADIIKEVQADDDPDSIFKLLWNYGPELNTRQSDSIGWANDLIVGHAFNDHDVLVVKDDVPYLMWAQSTSGLFSGQLLSGPVFVAGTSTAEIGDGITASVTVLQQISEEELKAAVERTLGAMGDGFRLWTSSDGSSTVEAKLLDADAETIVLKKHDGSIVSVARNSLSQRDLNFIDNQ